MAVYIMRRVLVSIPLILGLMTPAKAFLSEGIFGEFLQRAGQVFEGAGWESQTHRAEKVRRFQLANAGVPLRITDLNHSIAKQHGQG